MNKETIKQKTFMEKAKESFGTALMSAGIVLVVLFILWIPLKVIPAIFSHGTNFVSTSLSSLFISAEEDETKTTQNNNTNTTTNSSSVTSTNKPAVTNNTITQVQKTYYGKSDLEITLISTGIIDPISKQFIATNYAGSADEIGIKFQVKNIGTNVSGNWRLRIVSPSRTTPYFDSAYQTSIKPGDRMIFTASFDSPIATGINTAYITADPLNMVSEISESNNQIIVPIKIEGLYYNYNTNYNYGNNIAVPNLPYGTLYTWTDMNVNCYANPQTTYVGSPITWYATASGGNGLYSYTWTGSDLLNSDQSSVSKTYYSSGMKTASVSVTSNGQTVTKQCSVYVY